MNYADQLSYLKPRYEGKYDIHSSRDREEFLCSSFRGCPRKGNSLLVGCDECILNRDYPKGLPAEKSDVFSFLNRVIVLGE